MPSPSRAPASDSSLMRWSVAAACLTASAAIPFDSWTRRVISAIELESSSDAVAAVRTAYPGVRIDLADARYRRPLERDARALAWRLSGSGPFSAIVS